MSEKKTGIIKRVITQKGYGFIKTDEGEVFFHLAYVVGGPAKFQQLRPGDRVSFSIGTPKGKECAVNVVVEEHIYQQRVLGEIRALIHRGGLRLRPNTRYQGRPVFPLLRNNQCKI
jgi:cold shock CspA family protein